METGDTRNEYDRVYSDVGLNISKKTHNFKQIAKAEKRLA